MPIQREGARFIAAFPEGYEQSNMVLGPDNRIWLVAPYLEPVYLDEATMRWEVLQPEWPQPPAEASAPAAPGRPRDSTS